MTTILGIDPGTTESAWCFLVDGKPERFGKGDNHTLRLLVQMPPIAVDLIAIEMVASFGMPVGREVFETVRWIGRFEEVAGDIEVTMVYRQEVKLHLCHSPKANDASIRQALIDRWGGRERAITGRVCAACKGRKLVGLGKKRGPCAACAATGWEIPPGPLRGVASDAWSAIALAVTASERTCAAR